MGSALLYLAIVVMWLSVLLPMWLRRDRHTDDDLFEEQAEASTLSESLADDSPGGRHCRRRRRHP
ncbi:hypothetical protein [Microbispora sp. GKU 823]|uniref:hypothetical protein n=1 Tax=Microbispora sp. GKU 823 TaxID=1652100 RepID=UPI0009A302DB|nr:hypothetical protein [Microbispora sp. GKU 823]OPG14221.1 hypothetical protein B1L11_04135 [Microbispora sp. GKU 823]